jgi:hypothetical protein
VTVEVEVEMALLDAACPVVMLSLLVLLSVAVVVDVMLDMALALTLRRWRPSATGGMLAKVLWRPKEGAGTGARKIRGCSCRWRASYSMSAMRRWRPGPHLRLA